MTQSCSARLSIVWASSARLRAASTRLLQKAARVVRRRGSGLAIFSGSASPRRFPSFQRFTRSPDQLASPVAVDSWDMIVAFVAHDPTGGTEAAGRWRCGASNETGEAN
jgi:hypothetical protein